mmetsp:Transcript_93579/g.180454  ORF Transcript_93579/g.180454 Transcript_93579/m.180454 type:complete len:985 (+) Transcript_93579:62-3016(+)
MRKALTVLAGLPWAWAISVDEPSLPEACCVGLGVSHSASDAPDFPSLDSCGTAICDHVAGKPKADGLLQSRSRVGQMHTATDDTEGRPRLDALMPRIPRLGDLARIMGGELPWRATMSNDSSICGQSTFARQDYCPVQCPFAAEMANNFCHFRCVKKEECGLLGTVPTATIPDYKLHTCRHCSVEACRTCVAGKPGHTGKDLERCSICMPGYHLTEEGECRMRSMWAFVAVAVVTGVIAVILLAWYLRMCMRRRTNQEGIDEGLASQRRAMLLQTDNPANAPYPITTNLLSTDLAGAGTICFFRFQFAILVWAVAMLAVWFALAIFVSVDLLTMGRHAAESPQLLCAVVNWGAARQHQLLWTKVTWLAITYVLSVVCFVVYAIQQTNIATKLDAEHTTMSDFAAALVGLPRMSGKTNVEASIKEIVEQATGEEVVGVSAGWDYSSVKKTVMQAAEELCTEQGRIETAQHPEASAPRAGVDTPVTNFIIQKLWQIDVHEPQVSDAVMEQLVQGIECEHIAFVVFKTEKGADKALKAVEGTGIEINGAVCTLEECLQEPPEIIWDNLCVTDAARSPLLVRGTLVVTAACLAWTIILYLPYAHYMASFSYANGDEPGMFSEGLFIGLVVGSQFGIFIASTIAASNARFHYTSQVQTRYTIYYTAALILNLVMDILLQGYLSYREMVGAGAHTASGHLLGELTSFQEVFESYPMQKSVGKLLFKYCWPCTFLVPFLFEPILSMWWPQHLARHLVGADPRIKGVHAIKAFELPEMEQRRYADLLFNVTLVACIPFISPAYLHITIIAMLVSHVFLYCYDHVKVLRYVVKFECSSLEVHHLAMQLFSIPLGILAGALAFKANQLTGHDVNSLALEGYGLAGVIVAAMVGHVLLHLLTLTAIKKMFTKSVDRSKSEAMYEDAEEMFPASYFSLSPVHCLRSRYGLNQGMVQEFIQRSKTESLVRTPRQFSRSKSERVVKNPKAAIKRKSTL